MKLRNLDVLRACLALMVLVDHARMLLWMGWQDWKALPHAWWEMGVSVFFAAFRFGHQAVMVFFALSGFFIHLRAAQALVEGRDQGFNAMSYLARRARRILPPYYAVLIFTVLLDAVGHHWFPRLYAAQTGSLLLDQNFTDAGYRVESVVPALLAQPSLFGIRFGGNGPLWSIGHEVFYYLLYPLFMMVWLRHRGIAYALGLLLGLACWFVPLAGWWSGMMGSYPVWLAGALTAEVLLSWRKHQRGGMALWAMACVTALAALAGLHRVSEHSPWTMVLNMVMGAAAIAAFELMPFDLLKTKAGLVLEWLGLRSYSIYIFHFPVLVLLSAWCFQTYGGLPSHGWLAAAGALLSLGAGLLGFHLVERRFMPERQVV
jgi:peptidoglycan/LPS O-acetylase OafA/YrhL